MKAAKPGRTALSAVHGSGEMVKSSRYLEAPQRLRAFVRAHESSLVVLALLIGTIGGLAVAVMSTPSKRCMWRCSTSIGATVCPPSSTSNRCAPFWCRASAASCSAWRSCCCCAGGRRAKSTRSRPTRCMAGGCRFAAASSYRCRRSGRAASAPRSGWKRAIPSWPAGSPHRSAAAFTCAAPTSASWWAAARAAAIAGAFSAPLAGAFYAFELVIGGYTPASLTPVGIAAVAGYFVAHAFSPLTIGVGVGPVGDVLGRDLAVAAVLGIVAALVGIAIMRGVALCEALLAKTRLWPPLRPALGGLAVGLLALVDAAGDVVGTRRAAFRRLRLDPADGRRQHVPAQGDRLHPVARQRFPRRIVLRHAVSGRARRAFVRRRDSMRSGRRSNLDPNVYAIIGMSALSASVIGGPLTMSFIALESTGNLWLTTAVLVAVIIVDADHPRSCSAIRSRPGASICAAKPSAAPPTSAGSATSRCAA